MSFDLRSFSIPLATAAVCLALSHSSPSDAQGSNPATGSATPASDRCAALANAKLDQVAIESTATQPASAPVPGARMPGMDGSPAGGAQIAGLPAFCRVIGRIHPEPGSDIRFEIWMPSEGWTGRLNGGNNGGFAGSIAYSDLAAAVKAGQAGASTDTGHTGNGLESEWAKGHPERVRDYGWRGIHLTTVTAKKLIASFYGRGPDHSYFIGCSNGGRQALMEASRFPEDYDGIIAGAPAAVFTQVAMAMTGTVQAQLPVGAAIKPEQARLLQSEVIKQCDAIDSQIDNLVADPMKCKVDLSRLACGVDSSPQCFTPPQLTALEKIIAGPRDASGAQLTPGFPASGAEVGNPAPMLGWEGWILSAQKSPPAHVVFATGLLRDLVAKPFATPETFDFKKDPARLKAALSEDLDVNPDLRRFVDRGGKLIIWHGWADAAISPLATLDFYQASLRVSGSKAKESMRLFMVPGMQHCFGGTGAATFGQMGAPPGGATPDRSLGAAIQAWVETGRSPESLIGRKGIAEMMGAPSSAPEQQRLLCAYPNRAVLRLNADPDKASSYDCRP